MASWQKPVCPRFFPSTTTGTNETCKRPLALEFEITTTEASIRTKEGEEEEEEDAIRRKKRCCLHLCTKHTPFLYCRYLGDCGRSFPSL